jgi:hypothetical protein
MAAGLGFKDFVTGEVLTAADVDGYLMQGVWVFASAAARDAAVTSPQEGNFAYLKDTNVTTYYTGSAWANLDTTGMTNPMTTTGDTIYSSSGSTPARLGIGSNGQVLTVSGGIPSWATAASGGGMTLISETVASANSSISLSSISGSYKQLILAWSGIVHSTTGSDFAIRFNNSSTADTYLAQGFKGATSTFHGGGTSKSYLGTDDSSIQIYSFGTSASLSLEQTASNGYLVIDNYASTTKKKQIDGGYSYYDNSAARYLEANCWHMWKNTAAITSIDIVRLTGSATISNIADTSIRLYGVS